MPRKKSVLRAPHPNMDDPNSSKDAPLQEVVKPLTLDDVLRDLPEDMVKNLPTVVSRLNAFIAYFSALNLKRLTKLTSFVIKAEEVLFDDDTILNLDSDSLKDSYKQAKSATLEILDLARKVALQIPQDEAVNKEVDEVYKLLKSLSPESLSEIRDSLMGFHSDSSNE